MIFLSNDRKLSFQLGFLSVLIIPFFTTQAYSDPVCLWNPAGASLMTAPSLSSINGVLSSTFYFQSSQDNYGITRYCFTNEVGQDNPTLRVKPGDHIRIALKNLTPPDLAANGVSLKAVTQSDLCADKSMDKSVTNIHWHGTRTSPHCGKDGVVYTFVKSGETYAIDLDFPKDHPPGLYWYHPHPHGRTEKTVQGGASGAIIVEGIENYQPLVAGLPEQVFLVRDHVVMNTNAPSDPLAPAWDISVNNHPVFYPDYTPPVLKMSAREKQFWRVGNVGGGTSLDLMVLYDGVPQNLTLVSLDGVPFDHQKTQVVKNIFLPTAGRAEFIVEGPDDTVKNAVFISRSVDTGPAGDYYPDRPLAKIVVDPDSPTSTYRIPLASYVNTAPPAVNQLLAMKPSKVREFDFSSDDDFFYLTERGNIPKPFDMSDPPAVTVNEGTVEDWIIYNPTGEIHDFHIHQLDFLVLARNGVPVSADEMIIRDTIGVDYRNENMTSDPSVTLRMNFVTHGAGRFFFHCHKAEHADGGMMQMIQVNSGSWLAPSYMKTVLLTGALTFWNFMSKGSY